jgi:2,3-diketo-5-methylthio-1-phosphopentane phosphatase
VKTLLIACDFDGTITVRDTLHVIVEEFGARGVWDGLEPRLRAGELTLEQVMCEQFAAVRAPWDEVRESVLRSAPVRAGFHELVDWCGSAGHRLVVFSSGFRSVIDAVLGAAGLAGLEVLSHEARFSPEGCSLVWAERGDACELCGRHCKRYDLRRAHRAGETLVYLGDGISDRCPAQMADVVFARAGLAEYLAAEGVPFLPFEDFHEVRRRLDACASRAA